MKKIIFFLLIVVFYSNSTFSNTVINNDVSKLFEKNNFPLDNTQMLNVFKGINLENVNSSVNQEKLIKNYYHVQSKKIINFEGICSALSVGRDESGELYWLRSIDYDCETGIRRGYYDYLTGEYFLYND